MMALHTWGQKEAEKVAVELQELQSCVTAV